MINLNEKSITKAVKSRILKKNESPNFSGPNRESKLRVVKDSVTDNKEKD